MIDSVTHWLKAASRAPLLTAAEEIHLATLVKQGLSDNATPGQRRAGARAKNRMITANLRLVASVSRRFLPRLKRTTGLDHLDILQEGSLGLNRAVEKFDPEAGYKFSTYAHWWVVQAMGRLIQASGSTIYLPASVTALVTKVHFAPAEVKASRQALQNYLGATEGDMARLNEALLVNTCASLDALLKETGEHTLGDFIADPNSEPDLFQLDLQQAVEALKALPNLADEVALLELNVGGVTHRELSKLIGQSRSTSIGRVDRAKERCALALAEYRDLIAA
jgi:RNA polymerase primary sigma factor